MAARHFLWITDLHYELPDANYVDDDKEIDHRFRQVRDNAFVDFNQILEWGDFKDWDLSFIAIGGDITSTGKKQGFKTFLDSALPKLQKLVPSAAICVVPGNHDVKWGMNPTQEGYFDEKFAPFREMVNKGEVSSCLFPTGELGDAGLSVAKLNLAMPPLGDPWYIDSNKRVIVLNVNSAIRCGEQAQPMLDDVHDNLLQKIGLTTADVLKNEKVKKYFIRDVAQVTQQQIDKLSTLLNYLKRDLGSEWRSYLRVALLHHHVVHFSGQQPEHKGYEFLVDSPRLMNFLTSFDFDIVLTGHKHQDYQLVHRWREDDREREIFVIGGPCVGGYSVRSFQGLRLVTFDADQSERKVEIRNIPLSFAQGDIRNEIRSSPPIVLSSRTTLRSLLRRASEREGYSYRHVASITNLAEDGDAHRIVEFDDLVISRANLPRAKLHEIDLAPTSGYLRELHARATGGSTVRITVTPPLPEKQKLQRSHHELTFQPPITRAVSYRYSWLAVNAFAMDKLQFERQYGRGDQPMKDIEFTHYIPEDPIGELTIIVRFPQGYKLKNPPALRIAKVDATQPDSARWETDADTVKFLEERFALRYFESINTAALRVQAPTSRLAYGIHWELPDAPQREGYQPLDEMVNRLLGQKELCLKTIFRLLETARKTLVRDWKGDLDGSLMAFDFDGAKTGILKMAAAGLRNESMAQDLQMEGRTLKYGEGIAGRAFKANRIRVYLKPQRDSAFVSARDDDPPQPDYYEEIQEPLRHKTLLSFPLHIPVSDEVLKGRRGYIYQNREPYGVFSIGSQSREEESVSELQGDGKRSLELLEFQHFANQTVYNDMLSG